LKKIVLLELTEEAVVNKSILGDCRICIRSPSEQKYVLFPTHKPVLRVKQTSAKTVSTVPCPVMNLDA
jgi:hypothetical protein